MESVLLVSPDVIKKRMAGPAIRYFNFAKELSKYLRVTLYIPNKETDIDFSSFNFKVIKGDKSELKSEISNVDSVLIQGIALRLYPFIKKIKKPIIIDIYDPLTLENLELRKNISLKDRELYHETDLDIILEQLSIGDYFICANEKQKDYWLGMLSAINRVNPYTYTHRKDMSKLIGVVPFGLENEEPKKTKQVLKGVWKGIDTDDKVLIWGGGIWNWFDPITLIKAMDIICKKRSDIKLFFMGIGHPNSNHDLTTAEECIKLSKDLGLYETNIFFNDWVEYEERQNYLLEADIGISTYYSNLETMYSFRTRVLDYLWCELPMILTKGDYMSELIVEKQIGLDCKEKDEEDLANTVLKLLDDKEMYTKFKKNISKVKQNYKWETVSSQLIKFCDNPYISHDKKNNVHILYSKKIFITFKYYYVRIKVRLKKYFRKLDNDNR